jgi:hypothetical protein
MARGFPVLRRDDPCSSLWLACERGCWPQQRRHLQNDERDRFVANLDSSRPRGDAVAILCSPSRSTRAPRTSDEVIARTGLFC